MVKNPRFRSRANRFLAPQVLNFNSHQFKQAKCQGVYIVFLSLGMFFFTLMILTIGIKNSSQARAWIHNGFWFWKLVIILGIIAGMAYVMFFHLESDPVDKFLEVWKWIGVGTGE